MTNIEKPPLGLTHRDISYRMWLIDRNKEILQAMNRYDAENVQIPLSWVEEYANNIHALSGPVAVLESEKEDYEYGNP